MNLANSTTHTLMMYSPRVPKSFSAGIDIYRVLWNLEVRYRV